MFANLVAIGRWAGIKALLTFIIPGVMLLALSACEPGGETPAPASPTVPGDTASPPATATLTPFPPTPTPTPIPLAATVNGEPILLAEFEAHQARLQAAQAELGTELAPEVEVQRALQDVIDQRLLAQAAAEDGFVAGEELVEERLARLREEIGGEAALNDWLARNNYTEAGFRADLALSISAAWMRDQIVETVTETAEQVYARQILLYNSADAEDILAQLQAGADFEALARAIDPQGYGDLGWFPRGYLTESAIEQVAFSLQPGEFSEIIETGLGYHIILVEDRQAARPLDPGARLSLQVQAFETWLDQRRQASEIIILVPSDP